MEAKEIYIELQNKETSARMVAEALNVSNQSVSEVIRQGKGSRRIAEALAKIIGKRVDEVFPHYREKTARREKILALREKLMG